MQSINKFIKDHLEYIIELPTDKKEHLILAIDSLPMIIDTFISLQKDKYKINRRQIKSDTTQSNQMIQSKYKKRTLFRFFRFNNK